MREPDGGGRLRRVRGDVPFLLGLGGMAFLYLGLIVAMVLGNVQVVGMGDLLGAWESDAIRASVRLTLLSCTLTAVLAVLFAAPIGYLLSRFSFRGKGVLDAVLDIPIVLPPLVVGLSLLLLFNRVAFLDAPSLERWLNARGVAVTFSVLAWARALGEFGPVLVFAGATRGKTEVLATSVFLEINMGNLGGAAAVSLLMIVLALVLISGIRMLTRSCSNNML